MSLIAHWPLNGNTNDLTTNIRHGVPVGTLATDINGKIGSTYIFTNSINGVNIPNNNFAGLAEYTMAAWVNPAGSHQNYNGTVLSSGNWNGSCWAFGLKQDNSAIDVAGRGYNKYITHTVPLNTWTHILCRVSNNVSQLFVNGNYISELAVTGTLASDATNTFIGRETYADGYFSFNGKINDVRIYDHALSTKEIKELAKAKILHYKFDDFQEPTTNLWTNHTGVIFNGAFNGTNYSFGSGTDLQQTIDNTSQINPQCAVIKVNRITGGTAQHDYVYWGAAGNLGETRTYSFWYYGTYGTSLHFYLNHSNNILSYLNDSGAWVGTGTSISIPVPEKQWKKIIIRSVNNGTTLGVFLDWSILHYGTGAIALSNKEYWLFTELQCELKDHATPFVFGSRDDTIRDVSGYGNDFYVSGGEPISFSTSSGVSINGNNVTKTAGTSAWDAGAISNQKFYSDCFLEWEVDYKGQNTAGAEMVGFTTSHSTWNYTDIAFAIYTHENNSINIYELGTNKGAVTTWDPLKVTKFRIDVVGTTVKYYMNNSLIYTSATAATFPLFVDMSLHCHGAQNTIKNLVAGYLPSSKRIIEVANESELGKQALILKPGKVLQFPKYKMGPLTGATISFWRKRYEAGAWIGFSANGNGGGNYTMATAGGTGAFYHSGAGSPTIYRDGAVSTTPTNDDLWHHYCMTGVDFTSWAELFLNAYELTGVNWPFDGIVDDIRIYATTLSAADVKALYEERASLDNKGNLHVSAIRQVPLNKPLVDYLSWQNGQTAGVGQFSHYGIAGENTRAIATDPWNRSTVVWRSIGVSTGIYMNSQPIDNTKLYRMCVWERRVNNAAAIYGRYYFGLNGYGSVNGVYSLGSSTANTNPYFWNTSDIPSSTQLPLGEWVMMVAHIFPKGYAGLTNHPDSGRYTLAKGRIGDITQDYRWMNETTTARLRTLTIYQGTAGQVLEHHSVYPRLDICDGTEPTISELLSGFDSRYDELARSKGYTAAVSNPIEPGSKYFRVSAISEVGPTDGLIAYYPFDKDSNDYSGNRNHASEIGTALISGIKGRAYTFNGTSSYISANITGLSNYMTLSAWVKLNINDTSIDVGFESSSNYNNTPGAFVLSFNETSGRSYFGVKTATGYLRGYATIIDTNWHHICVIYDSTKSVFEDTLKYYIDANPASFIQHATTTERPILYNGPLYMGSRAGTTYFFNGNMDDVRIYNKALTEAEIKILYEMTNPASQSKMKVTSDKLYIAGQLKEV